MGVVHFLLTLRARIALLILTVWGAALVVTSHPVSPVKVVGLVAAATDHFQGKDYDYTEISLQGDSTTYTTYLANMHPAVHTNYPAPGDQVALWTDPDFDWFRIFTTDVLAIQLVGEPDQPVHRSAAFDDPGSAANLKRLIGAGLLGLVLCRGGPSRSVEVCRNRRVLCGRGREGLRGEGPSLREPGAVY